MKILIVLLLLILMCPAFLFSFGFSHFYFDIFENHGSIMLLMDLSTGKIKDANNAAVNFYGYSKEELQNMNISRLNTLSSEQIGREMHLAATEQRNFFNFIHELKNGELRNVEVYSYPFDIDNVRYLFSIIIDVTERVQSQKIQEQYLINMEQAELIASIGFWSIDLKTGLTTNSTGVRNIYGLEKDKEYSLDEITERVLPEYRHERRLALDRLIRENQLYNIVFKINRLNDSKERYIHSIGSYDKERDLIFGLVHDITETVTNIETIKKVKNQTIFIILFFLMLTCFIIFLLFKNNLKLKHTKQDLILAKEKAESANNTKSQFLANMSHELRTPLNGIIGFCDLMNMSDLTTTQAEYNNYIKISSKSLLYLVNDLLDFSKISNDKVEIVEDYHDFRKVIDEVAGIIKLQTDEKRIIFNVVISEKMPLSVKIDSFRVKQILMNLLSNAVKFTFSEDSDKSRVTLKIDCSLDEEINKAKIDFYVIDTGIGIPKEKIEEIFIPFTQVDSSFTRKAGGTGLGLAITKRLVILMGGDLKVDSIVGHGSKFYFSLTKDFKS